MKPATAENIIWQVIFQNYASAVCARDNVRAKPIKNNSAAEWLASLPVYLCSVCGEKGLTESCPCQDLEV